ncbi:Cyclic nucleotide-gated cation channel beta-1, partial [Ophiophagus hannah]
MEESNTSFAAPLFMPKARHVNNQEAGQKAVLEPSLLKPLPFYSLATWVSFRGKMKTLNVYRASCSSSNSAQPFSPVICYLGTKAEPSPHNPEAVSSILGRGGYFSLWAQKSIRPVSTLLAPFSCPDSTPQGILGSLKEKDDDDDEGKEPQWPNLDGELQALRQNWEEIGIPIRLARGALLKRRKVTVAFVKWREKERGRERERRGGGLCSRGELTPQQQQQQQQVPWKKMDSPEERFIRKKRKKERNRFGGSECPLPWHLSRRREQIGKGPLEPGGEPRGGGGDTQQQRTPSSSGFLDKEPAAACLGACLAGTALKDQTSDLFVVSIDGGGGEGGGVPPLLTCHSFAGVPLPLALSSLGVIRISLFHKNSPAPSFFLLLPSFFLLLLPRVFQACQGLLRDKAAIFVIQDGRERGGRIRKGEGRKRKKGDGWRKEGRTLKEEGRRETREGREEGKEGREERKGRRKEKERWGGSEGWEEGEKKKGKEEGKGKMGREGGKEERKKKRKERKERKENFQIFLQILDATLASRLQFTIRGLCSLLVFAGTPHSALLTSKRPLNNRSDSLTDGVARKVVKQLSCLAAETSGLSGSPGLRRVRAHWQKSGRSAKGLALGRHMMRGLGFFFFSFFCRQIKMGIKRHIDRTWRSGSGCS